LIGKTGIDQITAHANEVVLKAGTALAGIMGIDQVTAHANEIVLLAGAAAIGSVAVSSMPNVSGSVTVSGTVAVNSMPNVSGSVTVNAIGAGENHLGSVGGTGGQIDATPTLTVSGSYSANDYVGTSGSPIILTNMARVNAGSGRIVSATLVDYAAQSASMELWLFDTSPTPPTDNAAWSITDADALKCIGVIPFSTYYASALNSVSPAKDLNIGYKCGTGSKNLFACLVTRGTPVYVTGDINIRLNVVQD
jgi:hypothetical protein